MATADLLPARAADGIDEDLTDEQIEQMLARATARLQQKSSIVQSDEGKYNFNFPKLSTGQLERPYLRVKGDIVSADPKRLLAQEHRRQANGIRKVEDPVTSKKAAVEVSWQSNKRTLLVMMKTIPITFLERSLGTVLVCPSAH